MDFSLGYNIEREDIAYLARNSSQLLAQAAAMQSDDFPKEIDPRKWGITCEDQNGMSACPGFGTGKSIEILGFMQNQRLIHISFMFTYLAAKKVDGTLGKNEDGGATISGAVQGVQRYGCCLRDDLPFPHKYREDVPPRIFDLARHHLLNKHQDLKGYDDWYKWLGHGFGPAVIGIKWVESIANHRGPEPITEATGKNYGGHCVCLGGFSEQTVSDGRRYGILFNSHTDRWGDNGTALVHPDLIDQWGQDEQCSMVGITNWTAYQPDRWDWLKRNPF